MDKINYNNEKEFIFFNKIFKKISNTINNFSNDLSIDLGTTNTLIYIKGRGVVLNEPSVVSIKQDKSGFPRNISAIGIPAKKMLGRTPNNISAIKPMKDGVIADFYITEKMLQFFIKKVYNNSIIRPNPRVLICVPVGATQVERRAIKESSYGAGARDVYLIEEPMAAAIGAGLPVSEPIGSMIVDIGGGTTEIAIISLNGIVYSSSIRIGGNKIDEDIIYYIKKKYGILIGEATAEKIKHTIGIAYKINDENKTYEIIGRNLEGLPKNLLLRSNDILEAINITLNNIISSITMALEKCPPELSSDISLNGIVLSGGGALLKNMDILISKVTNIKVKIAEDPLTCVARGGGKALELFDVFDYNVLN